jgi:excinuclease UvrABC nuclease subunit
MRQFLSGEHQKTKDELIEKMHSHARKLEFEEAQKIKELLDSIGHITEKQIARDLIE